MTILFVHAVVTQSQHAEAEALQWQKATVFAVCRVRDFANRRRREDVRGRCRAIWKVSCEAKAVSLEADVGVELPCYSANAGDDVSSWGGA